MSNRIEPAADLNLVPIMNLVTILIPFLLMAASFVSLAVIDSALPAICATGCGEDKPGPPVEHLRLSVLITTAGFAVSGTGAPLGVETDENGTVPVLCPGACVSWEDYPHAELSKVLVDVKDAHPTATEVIIVPGGKVDYATLIKTMDTTRAAGKRELFPGVVIAGGAN